MKLYSRVLDGIEAVANLVVLAFYSAIVLLVAFQVVNRFWLHLPIIWISDLAIICFIWLGFLTAALAVRHNGHFRMNLLLDLIGEGNGRKAFEMFAILMALLVFGLLLYTGYEMTWRGRREISPGLRMPMLWAYLSVPLSGAIAILFCLERAMKELGDRATLERAREKADVEASL